MTTTNIRPEQEPSTTVEEDRSPNRLLPRLGGLALMAAPVLLAGGALTSPPQEDESSAAYVASLAEDQFATALSANLFHYAFVLFAVGAVAAMTLGRGRRGRALINVGGIVAVFGCIQMTGLLLNDWFLWALGNELPLDQAVAVFETTTADPSVMFWLMTGQIGSMLGFVVLYAGLARAGVLRWWLAPLALLPMVAFAMLGGPVGIVVGLLLGAPHYVAGHRLVQRSRIAG